MTTSNVATELHRLVQQLHDERAEHVKAIEAIDQTFHDLGFDAPQVKAADKPQRGRPVGSKNGLKTGINIAKRSHKTHTVTADAFVLSFIQTNPGCTTAQVNEHWINEGRNGKADQTLFKLVKTGQIARKNIKGKRGSMYTVK
jgi:aminoglycoside/choline kinase family phosphotransferase